MYPRTGGAVADAIAREVEKHCYVELPRHFSLPASANDDRRQLVTELWSDLARSGPLWSTIRLVHEGRDLHPSLFMEAELSDGLVVHSSVNPRAVTKYLDSGATFVYNHLHETSYAVQRIQEILEYRIGARVWIQAYLTKAGETAFGSHEDDHNFVVVQLLGAKEWEAASAIPERTQRLLSPGDGIFLRSNTEHAVSGVGELSLHLTIAFDWLTATKAQPGSVVNPRDLQIHRQKYRQGSFLPVSIDSSTLQSSMYLRSASRMMPSVTDEDGTLVWDCAAGRFRLDPRLRPVLDIIRRGKEFTLDEIIEASNLEARQVTNFANFAVKKGILLCGI
jgi:hypothetical protein